MKKIPYYQEWREELVLFLDDGFDGDDCYAILQRAGYALERFSEHFTDEHGKRLQGIKDPEIIRICNRHGWLLVTIDKAIVKAHRDQISESNNICILATCNNCAGDVTPWAESLVKLKPRLERNSFKKQLRPWFGKFDMRGKFSTHPYFVEKPKR